MKRFDISYYDGEEVGMPGLPKSGFDTIQDAGNWCNDNNISLYLVSVTEWDVDGPIDAYGVHDIIGQCNLEYAFEMKCESLDF